MAYYPIFLDLEGKKVVVVGGGAVAQRKILTLLEYGAVVELVSRDLTPRLKQLITEKKIRQIGREFEKKHLTGAFMVIAATDDAQLNREIGMRAREKGLLINAVDQPEDCNFILPSVLKRGELVIAVSTSGRSPALAKKVRESLEKAFGSEYESLVHMMGRIRKEVLAQKRPTEDNTRIFKEIIASKILDAIKKKDVDQMARILGDILKRPYSKDDIHRYLNAE
ncbi:MAG: bifunctional precorrin-2 dehydrogenase/sirohydrochlorin ferrochelatase [Deltaproteobacteria bacterium]|nr:bifunctional precorrin-2 dehydrogenase/sirohydrochlorin ferrochelatase [Deltaproteobacteria bacterium]